MNALRQRLPLLLLVLGVLAAAGLLVDLLVLPLLDGDASQDADAESWRHALESLPNAEDGETSLLGPLGPGLAGGGQGPRTWRTGLQSEPASVEAGSDGAIGRTGSGVPFNGTVVGAEGRGASDVRVLLTGEAGQFQFVTDADGSFEQDLPPGRYSIWMQGGTAGGLLLASYLIDGEPKDEQEFQLKAAGDITIQIERGTERVAGVTVSAQVVALGGLAPQEGVTGADGQVIFQDLPQGRYEIFAQVPEGPSVKHTAHATPRSKPVRVRLPAASLFQGVVRSGADGPGVAGARLLVQVRPRGSAGVMETEVITQQDGRFEAQVPQGTPGLLSVEALGYAPWPSGKAASSALRAIRGLAGAGPVVINIALEAGAGVSGRVTNESSGRGVSGLTLLFKPRRGAVLEARTDEGGRYLMAHLNPDRYDISIRDDLWYPAEGQTLRVDVPTGAPVAQTLDVRVQPARSLGGIVVGTEGEGVNGARVWIVGGGRIVRSVREAGRDLETFTDASGRWRLRDVPPGLAVHVRAALGKAEATPLFIPADQASALELKLVLALTGTAEGTVVDLITRDPVAGARVEARPLAGDGRTSRSVQSDAQGRYTLEGLLTGEWQLRAYKTGYLEPEPDSLVVREGADRLRADVRVDPGEIFAGRVLGTDGKPLLGTRVQVSGTDENGKRLPPQSIKVKGDGQFRFTGFVHRGTYEVRADRKGYATQVLKGLRGGSLSFLFEMETVPTPK